MIPVSSNTITNGCNPISSNCVVWQGPDISCINICTGDTVSDVVAKLATELCTVLDQTSLSNLDLSCLNLDPQDVPTNFSELQQLIIDELCSLGGRCTALEGGGGGGSSSSTVTATLPACLQYTNLQNDLVTVLPIDEYAELVAARVCTLISDITTINSTLSSHNNRITALENATPSGSSIPQVTPTCVLPSVLTDIDDVVEAIEEQFCDLRTATGTSTELISATGNQCAGLNSEERLSGSGTMSSISGWNTTVTNVADSLANMWLTICDMREAIKTIQQTCCSFNCNDVLFTFTGSFNTNILTLNFNGSNIPNGFDECDFNGALVNVSDGLGGLYTTRVQVLDSLLTGSGSVQVDLASSGLNTFANYTVTVVLCVTNGDLTCEKSNTINVINPASSCALPTGVTATIS
jgi:hypothetical protein